MRTLITGATGFLGSYLAERLVRASAKVAVLVRPQSDPWRIRDILSEMTCIVGDLDHVRRLRAEIAAFAPEVVFHLAWAGVGGASRNEPFQVDRNLASTVNLAGLAKEIGCRAFVGLGSQAEYGPCQEAIREETPTHPTTLYGAAKLSAYHLCRVMLAASHVRFAWVRLFSCYGPKDNPEWMLPGLIRTLAEGGRPALTGGEQRWDYIYVADAARAVQLVGECERAEGVLNLGSGQPHVLRSIIEEVRDLMDPSLHLGFGEIPYRPDQVMHLEADISKLRHATNWSPETGLTQGLTETVRWFASGRALGRNAA